jgi:hypothetical protein
MRLNDGLPVWHASITVWDRNNRLASAPKLAEAEAVRILRGVGGDREWWIWNDQAKVGHLRVAVTPAEYERIPPGCAIHDAGESGPQRPRT